MPQSQDWTLYIAVFAAAFGIALAMTPVAKKISLKAGAIDYPRERGMHKEPLPRMGGVAIVLGFLISIGIAAIFMPEMRTVQFLGFIAGAVIIAVTGMLDDIFTLKARLKFAIEIVAALIVVFSGTRVDFIIYPIPTYLDYLSVPFTLVWIVGVTNAVNIIDGLDGLAAGVSTIGAVCLMILCVISGNALAVILSAALAGSCLGFLPRNFNPAEVIMGDTGALFLGYVLAVSSITGVFKAYALLSVLIAFLVIALPIFDTLFAMIRRIAHHKPIMEADRGHLHHRLVDGGYSPKQAVVILYGLSVAMGAIAIVIAIKDVRAIIVTLICVGVMGLMVWVYRRRTK
ncbi:MAG: undecaprenyl/decaprenyl-phosphate alpha-N-acetylglucosaminyl 1-phosphate transferase [Defluviitaleaceae bacterium]|nr:undecaprenyl/decaprenyl-phosphate alpha-N-acetylglucosaminyl 1-phosphate transferase [Defluviitaleaceae bacterium]